MLRSVRAARKAVVALVAVIMVAGLSVAGVLMSNMLEGTITVKQPAPLKLSWLHPDQQYYDPDVPSLYAGEQQLVSEIWAGVTYGIGIRLQNPNTVPANAPTWTVIVKWEVGGVDPLESGDLSIDYFDGTDWLTLSFNIDMNGNAYGTFGPPIGFDVPPGYNEITYLKVIFGPNAPEQQYNISVWAETIV